MSGKPSHIPFFPDAYLRDNYRLTLEQHGLFLMLLCEAWNRPECCLPDDEVSLSKIAQIPLVRFRKIAGPVLAKWTREDGTIYQKRLRKEWAFVQQKRAKARAAIEKRWNEEKGYERNTDVYSDEIHLGGGGGEGVKHTHSQEEKTLRESCARDGLKIIEGGAQ